MGFTVPYIGAQYIHPNSVMSPLSSCLLDGFCLEIHLITDFIICCLFIGGGGRKEWFHGLENKGLNTARAKSEKMKAKTTQKKAQRMSNETRDRSVGKTHCWCADKRDFLHTANCILSPNRCPTVCHPSVEQLLWMPCPCFLVVSVKFRGLQ